MSRRTLAGLILLSVLFLLRYHWVLGVSWVMDDFLLLDHTRKLTLPNLFGFSDAIGNAYRPLSRNCYFWIGQRILGVDPAPYHALNLAVALTSTVLFFAVLRRLLIASVSRYEMSTSVDTSGAQVEGPALLGALLFISHPAAGTPVSWVCGIQDLLPVALALGAVLAHLDGRRILYVSLFIGALLSKEIVAPLPALLWFHDIAVGRVRPRSAMRRQLMPMAVLVLWVITNRWLPWNDLGAAAHTNEPGRAMALGRFDAGTVFFTLRALVLTEPVESFAWPYGQGATVLTAFLGCGIVAIACLPPWPRQWHGSAVIFGIGWALSGILPLLAVDSQFTYYAYYPALGAVTAVTSTLIAFAGGAGSRQYGLRVVAGALLFAMLTVGAGLVHNGAVKDVHSIRRASRILWTYRRNLLHMHPQLPDHARCFFWRLPYFAGFQVASGPALRIWYDNPTLEGLFLSDYKPNPARPTFFFMHGDDGLMEITPGLPDTTLVDPPPLYADALNDLGTNFMVAEERNRAIAAWRKAISIQPDHPVAAPNLGIALVQSGRFVEGVRILERAILITPENAGVAIHLAKGLASLGRNADARMYLREFLRREPSSTYQRQTSELLAELPAGGAGDLDAKVLAELEGTGSDLSIPHVLEFFLYFPAEDAVQAATRELSAEGFAAQAVSTSASSDWVCIATRQMVPEYGELVRIRARLNTIATRLGGHYEGWGTKVVVVPSR